MLLLENITAQLRSLLELEGWPSDFDWSNPDNLLIALTYGHERIIAILLEKGCPVPDHGSTSPALRIAVAELSWPNALEQMVTFEASVEARNCRGDTALHLAFIVDETNPVVDLLMQRFLPAASENLKNCDGLSLLHIACAKSTPAAVQEFLGKFLFDIDCQVSSFVDSPYAGYTPLHFAVHYGKYEIAALLLEHNANIYAQDRNGSSPFQLAMDRDDTTMITLILHNNHLHSNCVNKSRSMAQSTLTILEKSIHQNDTKTFCKTLQTHGLPGGYLDYELLIKALRLGRKRIVNQLLDKGCQITKPANYDTSTTPLHIAATKVGWSNVLLKLLARGARVVVFNDNGDTPIHSAFMSNAPGSVLDLLLKYYMRETLVNAVNKDGLGLLHIACTRPNLGFVRDFVDIGGCNIFAQVSLQTNSTYAGYLALHFAAENGRHQITKFLCKYEAYVGTANRKDATPLHLAVHRRDVKMIDILLSYADWNVNHIDSFGITHFMAACAGNDPEIVKQFLRIAEGTYPNSLVNTISAQVKNLDNCLFAGYTPMHFAAEFGRLETMKLLIDRGAHCTMTNQKLCPLDLARKRNHESIIALLEKSCRMCKVCEIVESREIVVDVTCNENKQKQAQVFKFNSNLVENQEASLDESCFLDIFPLPENKDNQIDDYELHEIFVIGNCFNEYQEDNFSKSKTKEVERSENVICNTQANSEFCKYCMKGQIFTLFVTVVACMIIVTCIFLICKL